MGTIADPILTFDSSSATPTIIKEESHTTTDFYLTGFGPFYNVPNNPTQRIIESLPSYLSQNQPLDKDVRIVSTSVLKVSAETTKAELEKMYRVISRPKSNPSTTRTVFVHMGVNVSVPRFQLELQGRNEATFSCPDEAGWAPIKTPIDGEHTDLNTVCRTSLRLDHILDRLTEKGFDVEISTDAGRFVCNWVYYNSLKMSNQCGSCALFVHVPPASIVPVEKQLVFITALLNTIAADGQVI